MDRRQLLIGIAALPVVAWAAPQGEYAFVDAKSLARVGEPRRVKLAESIAWSRSSKNTEYGLLAGDYEYLADFDGGRLFFGSDASTYMRSPRGEYLLAPGGLWLGNGAARSRFLIVQRADTLRRGSSLAAVQEATPGSPWLPPGLALLDALTQWASEGVVMLLPEIEDAKVEASLRAAFES